MKALYFPVILGCGLLLNSSSVARPYSFVGRASVSVTGAGQDLYYRSVSAKTNVIRGTTNDISGLKSTTTNFTINASSLLSMLANSLNTNFPAGTLLLLEAGDPGLYALVISDRTGTKISRGTQPVITALVVSAIHSGMQTEVTTSQAISAGNDTESYTSTITFHYDDTALATSDGTHTSFTWNGLVETKASINLGKGPSILNVTMNLTGGGQIRNRAGRVFTGTIRAKLTGGP